VSFGKPATLTLCALVNIDTAGNPSAGRILNRFSSDTATADDSLPFNLNILLGNAAALLAAALLLCFTQPLLLLLAVPRVTMYRCTYMYILENVSGT